MVRRRSVDLLPEIFQTDTNKKFLSATLDQLTQEPIYTKINGYVGRKVGPGVNPNDVYVTEPSKTRIDYQLEPGVVFFKPETTTVEDAITYPGMIDALDLLEANTTRQDRLFQSEYYAWDPFCDLDKFNNYSQYYWLPGGPDPVDVSETIVPLTDDFTVTRNTTNGAHDYTFSGIAGENPVVTLVRGGSYTFDVNQVGHGFWIQAAPGVNGTMPATPNISSRDVLGVVNNGEDQGTVTFNVPYKDAQEFYYTLTDLGTVSLVATDLKFNEINNVYVSTFLEQYPNGIDGITNLENLTIIFTNTITDAQDGGWQRTTQFDPLAEIPSNNGLTGSFDTTLFDQTTDIPLIDRYDVYQIQYILDDQGAPYMRLTSVLTVPNLSKLTVQFGTQWSSTQWYKNASGYFQEIPLLTAVLDTLWYQDATDPEIFGRIRLIDQEQVQPINIDDIIGAKNYTSPNGVVLTNGLKIQFRGPTLPTRFQNQSFYVEGVGTGLGIDARVGFIDGQAYFGPYHVYQGQKLTGSTHSETTFQQYIYETVAESLLNQGAGYPVGAPLPNTGIAGASLGKGIVLLPVTDFVTPETYTKSLSIPYDSTSYDSTPYDGALNAPLIPDYITINRASQDLNAWTRSNRWFHVDVIKYTAQLNNQVAVLDNNFRAKRPIIEFRPNLALYDFGTQAKQPVNIIDLNTSDALSNVNGALNWIVDGYTFINGTRVIFAADLDPQVRNRVYEVQFIDPDNSGTLIIDLVPVDQGEALINQTVVCLDGITLQGKSFWFDGMRWAEAQEKTGVNQPPLFDVFDQNGISFADRAQYPSTTFAGSKLFGYALGGSQTKDEVLGFALKFANINNVGDIVFENYLYTDSFLYVRDKVSQTVQVSDGFARQYVDRTAFSPEIGWQVAAAENRSRQVFQFTYDGVSMILDVPVDVNSVYAPIQIFVQGIFVDPTRYTYEISGPNTIITFVSNEPAAGTLIEVQVISDTASSVGYYQVPLNLSNNPLNENSSSFTLGTIRNHYDTIGQNLRDIQGPINGANNTRDLGDILRYGTNIIQNSAPMTLGGVFLRRQQFEAIQAIEFNSREYQKYKALLMDRAAAGDYVNLTATQVLDQVMLDLSLGRNSQSPFYWSDMVPSGANYIENTYTYTVISTPTFDTVQSYDFTSSNFLGLSVYLNGTMLIRGYQYTVPKDAANLTITVPLSAGDTIVIREYPSTNGNFVPNTPTKMGLYPAYVPAIYVDETYVNPTTVIRGHDGSITVAYGDFRDEVLLEFEKRIFNNLKIVTPIPLTQDQIIPGQFRKTDYSLAEINQILSVDFLSWVGWNKLNYVDQDYLANNEFTWNYSQSSNVLDQQPLLGAWRGIYQYFYDTLTPNTTPWEMLGFSQAPDWWESTYGPAPYTSGNLVLWEDLAQGLVRDPMGSYILPQFARPGLLEVIPAGSEGQLLSPMYSVVGNFDATSFRRSWAFGDDGPVESAWRTSSAWPFAVMRLLALTKPAKFFSLFADRDNYVYDDALEQYLWQGRYRLDAKNLAPLYGDGSSKASYIDWIIDYNRQLGINSTDNLTLALDNIGIRLCWRMAGYSDKKLLQLYTERSSPNSNNASLLLPDESYQILLYKDQPFERVAYSSVIVQRTDDGYAVLGYSTTRPYFEILASVPNGNLTTISAGGVTVRVGIDYTDRVVQVPYGYVFKNQTAVADFLLSYGRRLQQQGLVYETRENGYILDWSQMATEFLYWSTQGWAPGSIINLNPAALRISVSRPQAIVDNISIPGPDNIILNQNRQPLPTANLVIDRIENLFRVTSLTSDTINYLNLKFTAYEHLIVLDNTSIFADLIYDPITGSRQNRILAVGTRSGDWTGLVDAPGFVLNQDNVAEWRANQKYTKGQIVKFKNEYWSASDIIQPAEKFDYSVWIKSDYDLIQKGLLPNAANDSDQLALAYSVYDANLEQEVDLFSYGLIGFRPRKYMQGLDLNDTSQVQLYQQFLGTKGTVRSAELFTFANLSKEIAEYQIYEYWAVQKGSYGATANQNYFELRLDETSLHSNPCLIQVINPDQNSQADQTVLVQNIWKSSQAITSPNILPTTTQIPKDVGLPTAGYVNFDDVDYTSFTLADIPFTTDINNLGVGQTIWVAKVNDYDWNVYRSEHVPGNIVQVSDNLNARSLVQFTQPHGLNVGDILVIKYFDSAINGAYRVLLVPSIYTVTIDFAFTGTQTSIIGDGEGFTLQTARVAQASDAVNLPYTKSLLPGARIWVDNDGTDRWEVIEKTQPFDLRRDIRPIDQQPGTNFGVSVAQTKNNLAALIGAPGYNPLDLGTVPGGVWTYVKDSNTDQYVENYVLQLDSTGTESFGNAVDFGNESWGAAGASASLSGRGYAAVIFVAPSSNQFLIWQLLAIPYGESVTSADEFGYSVNVSDNERWLLVGAPGGNRVYVYQRQDYQTQSVTYVADGTRTNFNYSDHCVIDASSQLIVVVNDVEQVLGVDYAVVDDSIAFLTAPSAGLEVRITRRSDLLLTGDGSTTVYPLDSLYSATTIHSFSVYVNDVIQRPQLDYNFGEGSSLDLTFFSAPASGATIQVRATTSWIPMGILSVDGLASNDRFGHTVVAGSDGTTLAVGCPETQAKEGRVYVFDRSRETFVVTDKSVTSYTTVGTINSPGSVYLNGQILLSSDNNIGGQYTVVGNTVTITAPLTVGDEITVDTNQFSLIQELAANQPFETAKFGYAMDMCTNDCSLYTGAPFDGTVLPESGLVQFDINQSRVYGATRSGISDPVLTPGDYIRINDRMVQLTGTTVQDLATDINNSAISNVRATVANGRLTVSVINVLSGQPYNLLTVLPGTGTLFDDLFWQTFVYQQTVTSPVPQSYAYFGRAVNIGNDLNTLVIGAPNGTTLAPTTFDNGTTTFDSQSTQFLDPVVQSGAVYTFDKLNSSGSSITNPSQFVFGQQIYDSTIQPLDQIGASVNYTSGILLIGSPGFDAGDSQSNYGHAYEFTNVDRKPAWYPIRLQVPVVDVNLLNDVFMYDRVTNKAKQYFDYFDPLQGRLLGVVKENIDYIGAVDPASYNVGNLNNYGDRWGADRVGQIWWDISTVRFIDPNQDDIVYASRRWGQVFPGSTIDVYQWISSDVPPAQYTGAQPRSTNNYVITAEVNDQGAFVTKYYFWVSGVRTVDRAAKKTLSIESVSRYIESPLSSGISYIAPINASTIAIYNGIEYVSAQDTVLHVNYDQEFNDNAVHVEFQLIGQDVPGDFLDAGLYRKLQDSFCGVDAAGNLVPDVNLPISQRYGVEYRPRQSMFVNRFLALENYLGHANSVLAQYPIVEMRKFNLLNSAEPIPAAGSGAWDKEVANVEELSYQDLAVVPLGYKYLVLSDSTNNGLWTIYEAVPGILLGEKTLSLIRVQNYDTRLYWNYIDWYQPGYAPSTRIVTEVPTYSALSTLTVPDGSSVKVTANGQGKWEIYQLSGPTWVRVALQSGTIEFSAVLWNYQLGRFGFDVEVFDAQYFDQEPVIETRKIIQAINQELFIDDLAIERNRMLVLMFNYVLSEQGAPLWLTKTSLIRVDHKIRDLLPYQIYRIDNQDFVLDYIKEVKPYHTQIKQFNLIYNGSDTYLGTVNDFDLPAYWDPAKDLFVSPILDDTGLVSTTSSVPNTSDVWQTLPWNQWYQNYLLAIESVTIVDGGSGYTVAPEVQVTGECVRQAIMVARVNSAGKVSAIDIIDPGYGYSTTAIITFVGGNGSGAIAVANMNNNLVREFTVKIKYDRYQYQSDIVTWQPNTSYDAGTLVRYLDRVWQAVSADSTAVNSGEFDPEQWTLVPAADLNGVDRTMGYYVPTANQPGLDLALLISGVDYPGVQVYGPDFNWDTGFDVGNFDITPFDNISYGPEGYPTYDPAILDAIYESEFTDPYLGTLPAPAYDGDPPNLGPNPIVVDGGAFVDTYSSHAPEELIPGSIFDALDFRVFTTPGADWTGDGHGFPVSSRRYVFDAQSPVLDFSDLLNVPMVITVFNVTTGNELVPASVDWVNYSATIGSGAHTGDVIQISAAATGGGNQLYNQTYIGNEVGNTLVIPFPYYNGQGFPNACVYQVVVFVNGTLLDSSNYTLSAYDDYSTKIEFNSTYDINDRLSLTALGFGGTGLTSTHSWSLPITQVWTADGSLSVALDYSMQGTNPVNLQVTVNGAMARPYEGARYISDGSTLSYLLPSRGGYSQGLISDNDVFVYVNNEALINGVGFTVDAWDGSSLRTITLTSAPATGAVINVAVRTTAQFWVSGNTLTFRPSAGLSPGPGDVVQITSWNDTSQQDILTQVFVGPTSQGTAVSEGYDTTLYSPASVNTTPGSFDYSTGVVIQTNSFDTGRTALNPDRLIVTLDGKFLFYEQDYLIAGGVVTLLGPIINSAQIVTLTSFTSSVVPGSVAFRIFQDMRRAQSTYRITASTSTALAQPLTATADVIYVNDASRLSEPNLEQGIFGLITIDGERIAYRYRDTLTNTLSGLRRGTAGTGAAAHASGAPIYDIGIGNLLPAEYQDVIQAQNFLADGFTTVFTATEISVSGLDSTEIVEAVQVYVGGILQEGGYSIIDPGPVTVSFATPPTAGYQVSVRVRRGESWYTPLEPGVPLQEQTTQAARFIRGL